MRVIQGADGADGVVDGGVEKIFGKFQRDCEDLHDFRGQRAEPVVIIGPGLLESGGLAGPDVGGVAKIGEGFVAGMRRNGERADIKTFFDVRGRFFAFRFCESFGLERRIAVGVALVAHFHGELFFDGQIEEGAGGVPCAGDRFVRDSVAGDGEETGLAADFVDCAAKRFFFGWRRICECGKIDEWKVRHVGAPGAGLNLALAETLRQRGTRVNLSKREKGGLHR